MECEPDRLNHAAPDWDGSRICCSCGRIAFQDANKHVGGLGDHIVSRLVDGGEAGPDLFRLCQVFEAAYRYLLGDGDTHFLQSINNPVGGFIIASEDRRDAGIALQQKLAGRVASIESVLRVFNQAGLERQLVRLQGSLVTFQAIKAGAHIPGTHQEGNPPVAERDQVLGHLEGARPGLRR